MLTRDLVRFRVYRSRIIPQLVDPANAELLAVAGELLEIFKTAQGQTRSELLASTAVIIESSPVEAVISRGLEKLLLDRSEFDTSPDETLIELRARVFARTSELLSQQRFKSLHDYHQEVAGIFERSPELLAEELYNDLPDFQPLTHFRPLSPERLLHRYNTAQVQGLLLHCSELHLIIRTAEPAALRQLFKCPPLPSADGGDPQKRGRRLPHYRRRPAQPVLQNPEIRDQPGEFLPGGAAPDRMGIKRGNSAEEPA